MCGDPHEPQGWHRVYFLQKGVEFLKIDAGAIESRVEHDLHIGALPARLCDAGEVGGGGGRAEGKYPAVTDGRFEAGALGAEIRILNGAENNHRQISCEKCRGFVDIGDRQGIDHRRFGVGIREIAERIDDDISVVAIGVGFDDGADFDARADRFPDKADVVKDGVAGDQAARFAEGVFRVHAKKPKRKELPDPSGWCKYNIDLWPKRYSGEATGSVCQLNLPFGL